MEEKSVEIECPHCSKSIALRVATADLGNTEGATLVEAVLSAIKEWSNDVDIKEENGLIVVLPKAYLGKGVWQQINDSLREFGAEWVSAGKESRWIIKS